MKTILAILLLAVAAAAQNNVVYTWTVQASPTDTPASMNVTQDAATAGPNELFQTLGVAAPTTVTAAETATATTLPLANITGIVPGNGICIATTVVPCAITMSPSMVLSPGEVALVTAVTPGTAPAGTVTVKRGAIGTAAAITLSQPVSILRSGSYSEYAANILRDHYALTIANPAFGSASAIAAAVAIAAAQAALNGNAALPH
jgi:hypothetical protein